MPRLFLLTATPVGTASQLTPLKLPNGFAKLPSKGDIAGQCNLAVCYINGRGVDKDSVQAEVVKLRYFGGQTNEEVAQILDISLSTVKNYWAFARAWLLQEVKGV